MHYSSKETSFAHFGWSFMKLTWIEYKFSDKKSEKFIFKYVNFMKVQPKWANEVSFEE